MPNFNVGDIVIHVRSQKKAVVTRVFPIQGGMQIYSIFYDGLNVNCPEQQLIPFADISDEFEKCKQGIFGTNEQFVIANTTFKINNQNANSIATMMASKTEFKPYQYIPLLKFLYSANKRLLVADEVGLGKTIEAGHILLEMKARHELNNALIICPNSLLTKWQEELENRFNLHFTIYGSGQMNSLLTDIKQPTNFFGIVNYEKIRNNNLLDIIENRNMMFDFIICDEAHRMRNHTAAVHGAARKFLDKSHAVLFLTATPIMTSPDNLFWLLNLLDEKSYDNQYLFNNALKENAPFVRALSQLGDMRISPKKIIRELCDSIVNSSYVVGERVYEQSHTIQDKYNDVPIFKRIISQSRQPDNYELRVHLQSDISSLNVINGIFTRNRKRDVMFELSQAQRAAQPRYIPFSVEERAIYDHELESYKKKYTYIDDFGKLKWIEGRQLGYISLERQLASSLYSYLEGIDKAVLRKDAKYDELMTIYHEVCVRNNKKLIVFAVYNHTIDYLFKRMTIDNIQVKVINAKLNSEERKSVVEEFRNKSQYKILLASEVGSEGLDMQFCDALVNYDLPWNPMVVEQRIGRIDRIGQTSPVINIYNMVMQDTIHERIYYRLLERINIFTSCIGDIEAILDSEYNGQSLKETLNQLERQLYSLELTDEQKQQQADQMQMAFINEKQHLEQVSDQLTDTLTNDIYFRNEIDSIVRNYRYITSKEIINYIEGIIRNHLTTCTFTQENEYVYSFSVPLSSPAVLRSFLTENRPSFLGQTREYDTFINSIRGVTSLRMTFDRNYAKLHSKLLYIDPFHPLVLACMNYFSHNQNNENTFQFALSVSLFNDLPTIHIGTYFLAIYKLSITKHIYDNDQQIEKEIPLLYDLRNQQLHTAEEASRVLGYAQQEAINYNDIEPLSAEVIEEIRNSFTQSIDDITEKTLTDEKLHLESSIKLEKKRLTEYYTNRICQQELLVNELQTLKGLDDDESINRYRTLPMQETNLLNMRSDFEEAVRKVGSGYAQLTKPTTLLSLSKIQILP